MSHYTAIFNGPFATGNAFKQTQEFLLSLVGFDINQVGSGKTVLGN